MQINKINNISNYNTTFEQGEKANQIKESSMQEPKPDSFDASENIAPPKITFSQWFMGLSDEQIMQINKAKKLPDNCRFIYTHEPAPRKIDISFDDYRIVMSASSSKLGVQELPEGYEVRRGALGGAVVKKKDASDSFFNGRKVVEKKVIETK